MKHTTVYKHESILDESATTTTE